MDLRVCIFAFVVGALVGAASLWGYVSPGPEPAPGTVTQDTTQLGWDDLMASIPRETVVRRPGSTDTVCQDVPEEILFPDRPPPDTVYRRLYAGAGASAPKIEFGERSGLAPLARSSRPYLYLPLLEEGTPAIDHTGTETTVQAYGPSGRGYTFRYTYQRPELTLFAESRAALQWWPPTVPMPDQVGLSGGVDVGLRYRRGRVQAGLGYHTALGLGLRVQTAYRFGTWSP
jgi:hypothetical protein